MKPLLKTQRHEVYWISPLRTRTFLSWIFFRNTVRGERIYRVFGFDIYPADQK